MTESLTRRQVIDILEAGLLIWDGGNASEARDLFVQLHTRMVADWHLDDRDALEAELGPAVVNQ